MKATTGLLACQRYLNNLSHTVWIEVIVYEHNSYILYNMFTHHAGKRAADRRWSTDHTFSTATHQESRLKQVQHLHAFAANLLTHTKHAVSKPWKTLYLWSRGIAASTTHLHLPSSTTYNHLSFTINNKYLQLVQNNLLPHSFSCFHLNAHSHQLHRCSPRPSRPLHSAAWNGSVERQRGKRVERQCGTAAWNGSVECAKLLRSSFWHTPRCRSMLQNAAGSDLSTGSVERPRGLRHWRTPRCRSMLQNAAGSDLSTGSVERPRGVRQAAAQQLLAHSTLPFHAAKCSGVWPQHWQRGTAAWSAPLAHSTLPFHAAECSGVWPQHWQRGTAAWSAPLAHSTLPFHAAECSGVWPQHRRRWRHHPRRTSTAAPFSRRNSTTAVWSDHAAGRAISGEQIDV